MLGGTRAGHEIRSGWELSARTPRTLSQRWQLVGMRGEIWAVLFVFVTLLVPGYMLTRIIKTWVFIWYDLLPARPLPGKP